MSKEMEALGFKPISSGYWKHDSGATVLTDNDRRTFSAYAAPYACHQTIALRDDKAIRFRTVIGAARAALKLEAKDI